MPAEAGIHCLKSLDSGQKHAGMTMFARLFEFKSIGSFTTSKAVWYDCMVVFAISIPDSSALPPV